MEKYVCLIIVLTFLCLNLSGSNIEENVSAYSESYDELFDDFRDILDEMEIDSLKIILKSKGSLSEQKIFSITGDFFVSNVLSRALKNQGFQAYASLKTISTKISESSYIIACKYGYKKHLLSFLIEKDRDEQNYIDNIKGNYTLFPNLIIGDFRIKTGRGIFSDYADYYSLNSVPFFSYRIEPDMSKSEYPGFRGISYTLPISFVNSSIFLSFNQYDARIDTMDTVSRILLYNPHIDSLSISRRNNLDELLIGGIIGLKENYLNIVAYFSNYSHPIEDINNNKLYVFDFFGKINLLSYDIGFSSNGGISGSIGIKKRIKNFISMKTGLFYANNYFNPHSKYLFNRSELMGMNINLRLLNFSGIYYEGEFRYNDNETIKHRFVLKPAGFITIQYNYNQMDNESNIKVKIRGLNTSYLTMFNSFKITSKHSILIRTDANLFVEPLRVRMFSYYYSMGENDCLSEYEYTVRGMYPMKMIYSGEGIRMGINVQLYTPSYVSLNGAFIYDTQITTLTAAISLNCEIP